MHVQEHTYLFWVTVRVLFQGKPTDERVPKGFRAETELEARRFVLNKMLEEGYQVVKIEPLD